MATQKESRLSNKCIEYLKELQEKGLPIFYEHRSGNGGYNYKKGIPDLYVVVNGTHLEIEMKIKNGKLSALQENFMKRCQRYYKIPYGCPRTFDEFKSFIDNYLD